MNRIREIPREDLHPNEIIGFSDFQYLSISATENELSIYQGSEQVFLDLDELMFIQKCINEMLSKHK